MWLRFCYDDGKRCAETFFFDYRRQPGLAIKVARTFNTYGPRMHPADGWVSCQIRKRNCSVVGVDLPAKTVPVECDIGEEPGSEAVANAVQGFHAL